MKLHVHALERQIVARAIALAQPYESTSSIFTMIDGAKELSKTAKEKATAEFQGMVGKMSKELNVGKEQIGQALAEPSTLGVIKAFGYSLKTMTKCIGAAGAAVNNGVLSSMQKVHETAMGQKLHSGAKKLDELLDKHPMVKKVTGPVIAGLLAFQWMNMAYVGNDDLDFDTSYIADALAGSYSVADLVTSPDGMSNMAYVAACVATGGALSFPWLISDGVGIMAAVAYTAVKNSDKIPGMSKVKDLLKKKLDSGVKKPGAIKPALLKPRSKFAEWWDRLSKRGKHQYVTQHPNTAYKETS